jgi:hypothetical protein
MVSVLAKARGESRSYSINVSSGDEISKPFSYILEVVEEEMVKI